MAIGAIRGKLFLYKGKYFISQGLVLFAKFTFHMRTFVVFIISFVCILFIFENTIHQKTKFVVHNIKIIKVQIQFLIFPISFVSNL